MSHIKKETITLLLWPNQMNRNGYLAENLICKFRIESVTSGILIDSQSIWIRWLVKCPIRWEKTMDLVEPKRNMFRGSRVALISSTDKTCRWKYEATNQFCWTIRGKIVTYNFLTPDMQYTECAATIRLVTFIHFIKHVGKTKQANIFYSLVFDTHQVWFSHLFYSHGSQWSICIRAKRWDCKNHNWFWWSYHLHF